MRRLLALAAFVLLAVPCSSFAAATGSAVLSVESVLSPAWIERTNGRREPLAVGMELTNKDKIHTGDGGRVMLRMAEGSAVRLGESAQLTVDDLVQKPDAKGGVVGASLDVARGAFRFTTGLLAKSNAQRDVKVKVNVITAGIRGTDVWGKDDGTRDIICLLEGRITVTHGAAQFQMAEANSFYIAPRQGTAAPPSRVTPQQVKEWSDEVEIFPRSGSARRGGTASVVAGTAPDARTANALRDKLRDSGFPAETARAADGRYEVRLGAIADANEATALAERLRRIGFAQAQPAR